MRASPLLGKKKFRKDVTVEHVEPMDTAAWNNSQCREQSAGLSSECKGSKNSCETFSLITNFRSIWDL